MEQVTFNTRTKREEHMLVVINKSTHEEHLHQTLQTNIRHFKTAFTFLTGYKGIFNVTNKSFKSYFTVSINDDDFNQLIILPGAYEIESLNNELKQLIIKEGCFTVKKYPFLIKPTFSTSGSITEIKQSVIGSQISFVHDDSLRDLLL